MPDANFIQIGSEQTRKVTFEIQRHPPGPNPRDSRVKMNKFRLQFRMKMTIELNVFRVEYI